MADIEIKYNDAVIASSNSSGNMILETDGTSLEDDITIIYNKEANIYNNITIFENGVYDVSLFSNATINVLPRNTKTVYTTTQSRSNSITFENVHTRPIAFNAFVVSSATDIAKKISAPSSGQGNNVVSASGFFLNGQDIAAQDHYYFSMGRAIASTITNSSEAAACILGATYDENNKTLTLRTYSYPTVGSGQFLAGEKYSLTYTY